MKKLLDLPGVRSWLLGDIQWHNLPSHTVDALMEYFSTEMPYGVQKGRTGTPDEWIFDKLVPLV